jgi:nucleotide sugar dehydrogenase
VPVKVCVVGIGRMGLAVAAQFAEAGAEVIGADVDRALVERVNAGTMSAPEEPGLDQRLAEVARAGRLRATTDTAAAVRSCGAVVVLVRMVVDAQGAPDYGSLDHATASIAAGLRPGTTVSYETTLPVGDTRGRFVPALERGSGLVAGQDFHVCFSPERVSSGSIFRDLATYPKIVGGLTEACARAGVALYADHLSAEVWQLDSLEAAEFTKVAETTYRDVNIALANEFARFADQIGVDLSEVRRAANSQPYSHIHEAGVGVGGHCIPVYPYFFMARARDSRLVSLARHLNQEMPAYAIERLSEMLGGLEGRQVLVLGLAFRADLPESSHSVAAALVAELQTRGADVRVHDPLLGRDAVIAQGFSWAEPGDGWAEALVVQAAHHEYAELQPSTMPGVVAVLDGRWLLSAERWRAADVLFAGVGR